MSRVRNNIVANIAGQSWQIFLAVLCTPFYIKLLGIEAYGLIAFYIVIQNLTQILDFGLSTTVNREVARLRLFGQVDSADRSAFAQFVTTVESWYWALGFMLAGCMFFAVPSITIWWLQPGQLPRDELINSARIFGLLAFVQWPCSFYYCGLLGLQRQVALNVIQVPFSTVGSVGGLILIWLGPRSVSALLAWQAGVTLIQLCVVYGYFWKHIGVLRASTRFDLTVLRGCWKFSLGMSGISITGLVLTHLDKLILSRLLTLDAFGHYSLAGTLAKGLYVLITPVFNAYFPRLSALASANDDTSMRRCYHTAAQVMSVLIFPLAALIGFFSYEVALLWLRNSEIALEVAPLASLLVLGICFNGLMNIPFALQLAKGRTNIGLYINICLVLVLVPAIIFATSHYGATGGAAMWAVVNGVYVLVGIPITHKCLLVRETGNWLIRDVLPPLMVSLIIVGLGHILIPQGMGPLLLLITLAVLWILTTLCASMSAAHIRRWAQISLANFLRPL